MKIFYLFIRFLLKLKNKFYKYDKNKSPLLKFINHSSLYSNHSLLRLGSKYGGWLLPINHNLNSYSICYFAGAGEDISFDCALVEKFQVKARIIDPTPRAIKHFNDLFLAKKFNKSYSVNNSKKDFYSISFDQLLNIVYIPCGLAGEDSELNFYFPRDPSHVSCSTLNIQNTDTYFKAKCMCLASLMNSQGDDKIDLLKMDIEGGEYAVIDDLIECNILPRLLLIEFDELHTPNDGGAFGRIACRISKLQDAGMRCIAVDGCNATFLRQS